MGYSASQFLLGSQPRIPPDNQYQLDCIGDIIPSQVVRSEALANRLEAQNSYKRQFDKKAIDKVTLCVGDTVLLKRTHGKHPKMSVKWVYGPYKLTKKIGPVNWVVQNRKGSEKVYHQDLIKKSGTKLEPTFLPSHPPFSVQPAQNKQAPKLSISVDMPPQRVE